MLLAALPTDLIHALFLVLNGRKTLAAFLSTCRHLYEVFKAHPNSILRQVVCNEIGMDIQVLPYAWAALITRCHEDRLERAMSLDPEYRSQESLTISLTPWLFERLKETDERMHKMAKYYSIRFKEGRILRDTLTTEESRRFYIAAYLFSNYQGIWNSFPDDDEDNDSEDSDSDVEIDEEARKIGEKDAQRMETCHDFLASLPTHELLWLEEFRNFLLQDVDYALGLKEASHIFGHLSLDHLRHFLLSTSLEYFGSWGAAVNLDFPGTPTLQRKELWLTGALSRVLHERGVQTPAKDVAQSKILMNKGTIVLGCEKCGRRPRETGPHETYFNKTNLENWAGLWKTGMFPGALPLNLVERRRAFKRVHPSGNGSDVAMRNERLVVLREIIAYAEAQATSRLMSGEASGNGLVFSDDENESDHGEEKKAAVKEYKWSPEDVLCYPCFEENFQGLYYNWWLEERQTGRVEAHTFEDQCWWGIECHTQRKEDHASRRDHCCPRTRYVLS